MPKKKKAKKKPYFGMEVQDAIVRYNDLDPDKDQIKRNQIYGKEIHPAFDKLCENIINTFKFTYFDDGFEDVKREVTSFLVMNMHKYDHTKGSKAFSYFSVVAKNYLILHNNNNYKKYCTHDKLDTPRARSLSNPEINSLTEFIIELINYLEEKIPTLFKRKKDIDVAYSIIELLRKRDDIENFNKKSLYILIREMADVETNHITKVVNVLKKHYKKAINEYHTHGTLIKNGEKIYDFFGF